MGGPKGALCATTAAPVQLQFCTGAQFPAGYAGDAFVTPRGSWNRTPARGDTVVRVCLRDGQPVGFEDSPTGFLTDGETARFGRLVGMTQLPNGSLLIGDDPDGVICRVAYRPA